MVLLGSMDLSGWIRSLAQVGRWRSGRRNDRDVARRRPRRPWYGPALPEKLTKSGVPRHKSGRSLRGRPLFCLYSRRRSSDNLRREG